jgi:D-alanine-D-alanine ligase
MKVALCFNLKRKKPPKGLPPDADAEWDSLETVHAVRDAIAERHRCVLVEGNLDCYAKLRTLKPDLVFNIAEGWGGPAREGYVPTICEMLGIPYTASDPVTLNVCLHKARTKDVLKAHGIPTPRWAIGEAEPPRLKPPVVIKPLHEGSSKGVRDASLARTDAELRREIRRVTRTYRQPAIVEEFLPGREFTVAMIGNPPEILPVAEILFDSLPKSVNPLYSYEAKWIWDTAKKPLKIFECPAKKVPPAVRSICLAAWDALEIRDWCRIDVRCDAKGRPHILEVNPLPGILPNPADNSCFPKAARAAGLGYAQLINRVLDAAIRRYGL